MGFTSNSRRPHLRKSSPDSRTVRLSGLQIPCAAGCAPIASYVIGVQFDRTDEMANRLRGRGAKSRGALSQPDYRIGRHDLPRLRSAFPATPVSRNKGRRRMSRDTPLADKVLATSPTPSVRACASRCSVPKAVMESPRGDEPHRRIQAKVPRSLRLARELACRCRIHRKQKEPREGGL